MEMVKKITFLILISLLSSLMHSQAKRDFTLSLSAGISLDMASFGIENKYLSLQGALLTPGPYPLGVKPQFSFNNDHFTLFIPAVITFPISLDEYGKLRIVPYGGAGIAYLSDTATAHPLATGGMEFHYKSLFADMPVQVFFKGSDPDTVIGFYLGWSFSRKR